MQDLLFACLQTTHLYIFQAVLSVWNGFQFSFPTLLSYVAVAIMLRMGSTSFLNPYGDQVITPGDLAVASGVIAGFISTQL